VQHSLALFWVATAAIVLQLAFNLEAIRYTLYTGEPIYGGILRLWPGPKFWGPFYVVLAFLQLCWPALALSCANTLFSVFVGRTPDEASSGDELTGKLIALGLIVGVLILLHFGGTVERMLETASWFMLAFIFVVPDHGQRGLHPLGDVEDERSRGSSALAREARGTSTGICSGRSRPRPEPAA
jgi:hypothetical protein